MKKSDRPIKVELVAGTTRRSVLMIASLGAKWPRIYKREDDVLSIY